MHVYVILYQLAPDKEKTASMLMHIGDNMKLRFFGGQVEEGETPKAAAVRELQEECNLTCKESELQFELRVDGCSKSGWTSTNVFYSLHVPDIQKAHRNAMKANELGGEVAGVVQIPLPNFKAPRFKRRVRSTVMRWPLDTCVRTALVTFWRKYNI